MPCSVRHNQYLSGLQRYLEGWHSYFQGDGFVDKYRALLDEAFPNSARFQEYRPILQDRLNGKTPEEIAHEHDRTVYTIRDRHDKALKMLRFYVTRNSERFNAAITS